MKKVLGFLSLSMIMSCGQSEKDADIASTFNYDKFDLVIGCDHLNKTYGMNKGGPSFSFQGINYTNNPYEITNKIEGRIDGLYIDNQNIGGGVVANVTTTYFHKTNYHSEESVLEFISLPHKCRVLKNNGKYSFDTEINAKKIYSKLNAILNPLHIGTKTEFSRKGPSGHIDWIFRESSIYASSSDWSEEDLCLENVIKNDLKKLNILGTFKQTYLTTEYKKDKDKCKNSTYDLHNSSNSYQR